MDIWKKAGYDRERELGNPQRQIVHADNNDAYHGPVCRMKDSACRRKSGLPEVYPQATGMVFLRVMMRNLSFGL